MGNKDDTDAALRFHLLQQVLYGLSYIYHFIFFLCSDGDRFHLVPLCIFQQNCWNWTIGQIAETHFDMPFFAQTLDCLTFAVSHAAIMDYGHMRIIICTVHQNPFANVGFLCQLLQHLSLSRSTSRATTTSNAFTTKASFNAPIILHVHSRSGFATPSSAQGIAREMQ